MMVSSGMRHNDRSRALRRRRGVGGEPSPWLHWAVDSHNRNQTQKVTTCMFLKVTCARPACPPSDEHLHAGHKAGVAFPMHNLDSRRKR